MLRFRDALNNDNPVSDDLNLGELFVWYCAAPLILSNLAGLPLAAFCHRHSIFLLAAADAGAMLLSLFYHTCQTTHVCFGISLSTWTLADHISAPLYMMALMLFLINTKSSKQRRVEIRRRYRANEGVRPTDTVKKHATYTVPILLDPIAYVEQMRVRSAAESLPDDDEMIESEEEDSLSIDEIDERESTKTYYHVGYGHIESNDENNAWGVYSMYSSVLVVVLAALAHHFSLQAFIISFAYGLCLIFFKVVVIDEGDALNMYERVSTPDLIVGVVLILLSLVFYMLDIYVAYTITHSLWHCFSFLGSYFLTIGLTRHIDHWVSPTLYLYNKMLHKCLHREAKTV